MDPDRLAELEDERDHLLRSLDDLEAEWRAGDLDESDYRELRDGYTARAAQVMRSIDEGLATLPPRPPRRWGRLVVTIAVVVAVAVGGGMFVARSSGQRLPGQEITGGIPGDIAGLLSQARSTLGVDPARAQALYTEVLAERPNHPEALAYSGWLLAVNSLGAEPELRALALDTAVATLGRAIEVDPGYADPQCFLAIISANLLDGTGLEGTVVGGIRLDDTAVWVDGCLERDPPAELRGLIGELVG